MTHLKPQGRPIATQISLALYQPDIAANTGAIMRLCACFGAKLEIIEPCGFVLDDQKLRRAAMDYIEHLRLERHASWEAFLEKTSGRRLILMTTKAATPYFDFFYRPDDILLMGRESAGVPDDVHQKVDARLIIPMNPAVRSLNVGMSAAIILSDAVRQTGHPLSKK